MSQKLPELSVFFPAFNEQDNIEPLINEALKVLPLCAKKFEVIVVNDGSTDRTAEIGKKLAKKHRVVYSYNHENLGYGGALKRGFKRARFKWIFFTDADRQFKLSELKKFIKHSTDHKLVLGYRKNRAEGWKRGVLASALKVWNRVLLGFPGDIKDIDCAFKLMHRDVLKVSLPLESDGAMISTELLFKSIRAGFKYKQVGVKHYPRLVGDPSGNNLKVILRAVKDTFLLQWRLILLPNLKKLYANFK